MSGFWLHDRTYDHRETEDCSTVVLSADIGRYVAGTSLCDVLTDMARRIAQVDADYIHGFSVYGLSAYIAPYDPGTLGGSLLGVFGLQAVVAVSQPSTFGLDAVLVAPTTVGQSTSFGLQAYLIDLGGGAVCQLAADIDAVQTTITVTTAAGFPVGGDYLIQIDSEMMLVTGGQSTTTWTVIRGYNGTTATSHLAGSVVATC